MPVWLSASRDGGGGRDRNLRLSYITLKHSRSPRERPPRR